MPRVIADALVSVGMTALLGKNGRIKGIAAGTADTAADAIGTVAGLPHTVIGTRSTMVASSMSQLRDPGRWRQPCARRARKWRVLRRSAPRRPGDNHPHQCAFRALAVVALLGHRGHVQGVLRRALFPGSGPREVLHRGLDAFGVVRPFSAAFASRRATHS